MEMARPMSTSRPTIYTSVPIVASAGAGTIGERMSATSTVSPSRVVVGA
jgi:hypothetical protein